MRLTPEQKSICERVINVFETSLPEGAYGKITILRDGPNEREQITYGRSQTTEYGNLRELVQMYVNASGTFSQALSPYVERIGRMPLVSDNRFKQLLRDAARDPMMRKAQDEFFDQRYFTPAMNWAATHGFTLALSALIIYDSFVHSGSIPDWLRSRFPERPPALGGDEKRWSEQYVNVRHDWLANHQRPILRRTIYRTTCFKNEIRRANWDLLQRPIRANGVDVEPRGVAQEPSPTPTPAGVPDGVGAVPHFPVGSENAGPPRDREPVVATRERTPEQLEQMRDGTLTVSFRDLALPEYRALVKRIQERLIGLGFLDPPADGQFGPLSRRALDLLQEHDPSPDSETLDASLAQLLLESDAERYLPVNLVGLEESLPGKIIRYMRRNNLWFARLPGHYNIIYLEGANEDGTANLNHPNQFNDRRLILAIEDARPVSLGNWEATTEPGRYWTENPMNPRGAARIAFGQYKAWSVGYHPRQSPQRHEALVQVGEVKVYRDLNRDYHRDGDVIDVGSAFGINQHWGYDRPMNDLGRSSAGCLVGRSTSGHRQFMSIVKSDARFRNNRAYKFMTTIIPTRELHA